VLRGAAGSAVALPWLEIMAGRRARAAEAPRRYLVAFAGCSLGGDGDRRPNEVIPTRVGADYDLKTGLAPLGTAGVQRHVTVVSGLRVPIGGPAGFQGFHAGVVSALLTGVANGTKSSVMGTSSDQIVADALGARTKLKSLAYRVQAAGYGDGPYRVRDSLSYRFEGGAEARKIAMQSSPKAAYDALFYNFAQPGDAAARAQREVEWRQRRSVLDLVRDETQRIAATLGGVDRQRLDRHLAEIRELERQIAVVPAAAGGAACAKPAAFGDDPAVGTNSKIGSQPGADLSAAAGYSGEEQRARALCDLLHIAFACDLTRVGTLMFTMAQSYLNMTSLIGLKSDLHQISHYGAGGDTNHKVALGLAWHVKHWAYLVKKLADTPEAGGSLLDASAVVLLTEGGFGRGDDGKEISAHSGENMAVLVAGRAGGLKPGLHLPAPGLHPAQALITCMNAVGVPAGKLGNVSGEVPGLRG
jgi:hypothetical protein